MTKRDREIIRCILNHIASDDKLEEDIVGELERDGIYDFHEWLQTFDVDKLKKK